MGLYDTRIVELREQLKKVTGGTRDRVTDRLDELIGQWGARRNRLLEDLADRTLWAHVRTDSLAERWPVLIKAARVDLGLIFGDGVRDLMLSLSLQQWWNRTVLFEDNGLAALELLPAPRLVTELLKLQVGLAQLIGELDPKWHTLIYSKNDFRSVEKQAIEDIDRIVQDILDTHETRGREILAAVGKIQQLITEQTGRLRSRIGSEQLKNAVKVLLELLAKFLDIDIPTNLDDLASDGAEKVNAAISKVVQANEAYLQRVSTYRSTMKREGSILSMFKTTRDQVASYVRDNPLSKSYDLRQQAIDGLRAWAKPAPTESLFVESLVVTIEAHFERTKTLDRNFTEKYTGMFLGPLSDLHLEALGERYFYERQLERIRGRDPERRLDTFTRELPAAVEVEIDKAFAPLAQLGGELPAEARDLLLLKNSEFKGYVRATLAGRLGDLLTASRTLRDGFTGRKIAENFDRSELFGYLR
jgi:hypothetical protein